MDKKLEQLKESWQLFEKMLKAESFKQPWSDEVTLDTLHKIGEYTLPYYERILKKIVSGSKQFKILVDLKSRDSIESKIRRGKSLSKITDLVRGAILGSDDNVIEILINKLKRDSNVVEMEYKDFGEDPKYGYHGSYHILYKVHNSKLDIDVICEIQVMTRRLWTYKQPAHHIYNKTREMPSVPSNLSNQSKDLFKKGNISLDKKKVGKNKKARLMMKYKDRYEESCGNNIISVLYEDYNSIVSKAYDLAKKTHTGQLRRGSGDDYIVHPERIVKKLISHGIDSDIIIASAWLHDTFEDGSTEMKEQIKKEMPKEVVTIVEYLTKQDNESKIQYLKRCFNGPIEAQLIKVADRIDNLQDGMNTQDQQWLQKYYNSSKFIKDAVVGINSNSSLVEEYLQVFEEAYSQI